MTEEQALEELPERLQVIWKMRQCGATFRAIAKHVGVSAHRTNSLYFQACLKLESAKKENPWRNLKGNSYYAIRQFLGTAEGVLSIHEQQEFVTKAIKDGVFHPDKKIYGLKWKNYEQICSALGVEQLPPIRRRCPCCGHVIGK